MCEPCVSQGEFAIFQRENREREAGEKGGGKAHKREDGAGRKCLGLSWSLLNWQLLDMSEVCLRFCVSVHTCIPVYMRLSVYMICVYMCVYVSFCLYV